MKNNVIWLRAPLHGSGLVLRPKGTELLHGSSGSNKTLAFSKKQRRVPVSVTQTMYLRA